MKKAIVAQKAVQKQLDSIEKMRRIEQLLQKGYSHAQIAFYVCSSLADVERIINKNNLTTAKPYINPKTILDLPMLEDMNMPVWKEERVLISKILSGYDSFTVLNDTHSPYQNNALIHEMVQTDRNKVLLTVGDIFHLDSASHFRKNRVINFADELAVVLDMMTILSQKYEKVVMLMANHERRLIRLLYDKLANNTEFAEVFRHNALLTSRLSKVFNGNVLETDCFWFKVGKAILCHPDWYSKPTGKTVKNSYEYFMSFGETDFDAILNAHTHKCSKFMSMNKVMVELPCACKPQEYMNDGHRYNAEYYQGWTTFKTGKDGSVGFNDIDIHLYNDKKEGK